MLQLLKAENSLLQSQLDDMKAVEMDSQATIKYQEITINSLKTEKEVGSEKKVFSSSPGSHTGNGYPITCHVENSQNLVHLAGPSSFTC